MIRKEQNKGIYYGSWTCSDEANCELPTLEVFANTEKEVAKLLISQLQCVIDEAVCEIEELMELI